MTPPRAHHYLPRSYLRGFCDGGKTTSKIWVYEKGRLPRLSRIENEAHVRDLYSFLGEDGHRNDFFEHWLADLESLIGGILPRVGDTGFSPTEDEKSYLSWFAALLFTRVPEAFRTDREVINPIVGQMVFEAAKSQERFEQFCHDNQGGDSLPDNLEELRLAVLDGRIDVFDNPRWMQLESMRESARQAAEIFQNLRFQFVHADDGEEFITSDNPVMTILPKEDGTYNIGCGFTAPGVQIWIPLTRSELLRMGGSVFEGHSRIQNIGVREFNRVVMQCASERIYGSANSQKLQQAFERHGCKYRRGRDIHLPALNGKLLQL